MSYRPRLKTQYTTEVVPKLQEQFKYKSPMQVPKLSKICINQGVGGATQDKKLVESALNEMTAIAGQKCVPTMAKKSVSNFKLREGMTIGTKVTLRHNRMSSRQIAQVFKDVKFCFSTWGELKKNL